MTFRQPTSIYQKRKNFETVKGLPIPQKGKGKKGTKKANQYEMHLLTMDINDAVQGLTANDVQQFYQAAKKLGMKITARMSGRETLNRLTGERPHTIWRVQ